MESTYFNNNMQYNMQDNQMIYNNMYYCSYADCYVNNMTTTTKMSGEKGQRKTGKRPGRKPVKIDVKAKLERSRQSARECRARKKLRYQYIEELVANREKAVFALREELQTYKEWCEQVDSGLICEELKKIVLRENAQEQLKKEQSYFPFLAGGATNTTTSHVHREFNQDQQSQFVNSSSSASSRVPVNSQNVFDGASMGATNIPLDGATSYMPNRPPPSVKLLSEEEQIRSWYLFLKDDEERFSRDGSTGEASGAATPQPSELCQPSTSGVPLVVSDYLDLTSSSESSDS